jgi:hypothetical protein
MSENRRRSRFVFIPQVSAAQRLESRELMAVGPAALSLAPDPARVDFVQPIFLASQSDTSATITLTRTISTGTLDVRFQTDPGPGAGKYYQMVDTVVSFADGEATKTVEVPLVAGANSLGQVQVGLRLEPQTVGWSTTYTRPDPSARPAFRLRNQGPPAVLQILARPEIEAPTVVATELERQSVSLTFSEPMNAARASDRRNYVLLEMVTEESNWLSYAVSPLGDHNKTVLRKVGIRQAAYDPATNTVRLTPAKNLSGEARYAITNPRLTTARLAAGAAPTRALTDQAGNPLSAPSPTRPGQVAIPGSFRFLVPRGRTDPPLSTS